MTTEEAVAQEAAAKAKRDAQLAAMFGDPVVLDETLELRPAPGSGAEPAPGGWEKIDMEWVKGPPPDDAAEQAAAPRPLPERAGAVTCGVCDTKSLADPALVAVTCACGVRHVETMSDGGKLLDRAVWVCRGCGATFAALRCDRPLGSVINPGPGLVAFRSAHILPGDPDNPPEHQLYLLWKAVATDAVVTCNLVPRYPHPFTKGERPVLKNLPSVATAARVDGSGRVSVTCEFAVDPRPDASGAGAAIGAPSGDLTPEVVSASGTQGPAFAFTDLKRYRSYRRPGVEFVQTAGRGVRVGPVPATVEGATKLAAAYMGLVHEKEEAVMAADFERAAALRERSMAMAQALREAEPGVLFGPGAGAYLDTAMASLAETMRNLSHLLIGPIATALAATLRGGGVERAEALYSALRGGNSDVNGAARDLARVCTQAAVEQALDAVRSGT